MIHNRKTRRAADKYFADLIKEGWGDWLFSTRKTEDKEGLF
jgi:hypothetical protein